MDKVKNMLSELEGSSGSQKKVREMLALLKNLKVRRPDIVLSHGGALLDRHKSKLGNDVWVLYEDVALAALDCGDRERAKACIKSLRTKFGKESARVCRLEGMYLEMAGESRAAEKIYQQLLEKNPSNQLVKKRLVSLLCASGQTTKAIKTLVGHLEGYQTDMGAWQQLAKLYVQANCFEHAAFCYEELITANPREGLLHMMYAELMYTQADRKDPNKLRLARQYFAQSLEVKPDKNHRSLVGLAMSASALKRLKGSGHSGKSKLSAEENDLTRKLHEYAVKNLEKEYGDAESPTAKYALRVLKKQALKFK